MIAGVGVLRLVTDEDVRRAEADAERAAVVQAAAISRALDERGAAAPGGGRLLPEAIAVRASTAPDRLTRRVEELRRRAALAAEDSGVPGSEDPRASGDPHDPCGEATADGPGVPADAGATADGPGVPADAGATADGPGGAAGG